MVELRSNKFAKCVKRWEILENCRVKMGGLVGQKLPGREAGGETVARVAVQRQVFLSGHLGHLPGYGPGGKVLEVLEYTCGRRRTSPPHQRRVKLVLFWPGLPGCHFRNYLLSLSLCLFFALRKLVLFDIFLSCLPRRRPGEVRAKQGRRYWCCRHPDLIRKCPDFPRKSPDFAVFPPFSPEIPPIFLKRTFVYAGYRLKKADCGGQDLLAGFSRGFFLLEVCLRLGSFFWLSGDERFHKSLSDKGITTFLILKNWVRLTFFG